MDNEASLFRKKIEEDTKLTPKDYGYLDPEFQRDELCGGGKKSNNLTSPGQTIQNRLLWLDILKGMGIILVVLGHVYQNDIFFNFVYSFHMPLFFMAAGWLYKEKPVRSYTTHRFYTVMVPYFSFGFLILIYWQLIERRFRTSDMSFMEALIGLIRGEYNFLDFNVHLWFLPCFFLTVVIYNGLRNIMGRKGTTSIVLLFSIVYVVGVYFPIGLSSLPWGLDRVCKYIGFYAIGNWMGEYHLNGKVKRKPQSVLIAAVLLFFVFVLSLFNLTSGFFWFVTGTAGTVSLAIYSILLSCSGTTIINKLMSFLGQISLVVLCVHGPVYRVVSKVLSAVIGWESDVVRSIFLFAVLIVIITLSICSLIYVVIDRILPWMIGKPMKRSHAPNQ